MLTSFVFLQAIAVSVSVILTSIVCGVKPFWLTWDKIYARIYELGPYVALLTVIYLFNRSSHTIGQRFSLLIGLDITWELYALEGDFVFTLQRIIPYSFTGYFTFIYLFGFVFILVFPVIAYFALPSRRYLKELFVAYSFNYGVGAICYVLFIAYGPRKVIARVGEPMYDLYPQAATLTGSVNSSANVFPSLHVSLAVTVLLLAWRTRHEYPLWLLIVSVIVINIIIATMFLGIHWLIDVIAGIGLAVISVLVALRAGTSKAGIGAKINMGEERA